MVVPQIFWFDTPICPAATWRGDARPPPDVPRHPPGAEHQRQRRPASHGHAAGEVHPHRALRGRQLRHRGRRAGTVDNGAGEQPARRGDVRRRLRPRPFTASLAELDSRGIPDYQIAAPPQSWNAWGISHRGAGAGCTRTSSYGMQIDNGSHTDSSPATRCSRRLAEIAQRHHRQAVASGRQGGGPHLRHRLGQRHLRRHLRAHRPAAVRHLRQPQRRHLRAPTSAIVDGRGRRAPRCPRRRRWIVNSTPALWYEQGSVKQFFSIGLVNTTATYTPQPDGTIKVENSGNYFGPNGPAVEHHRLGGVGQRPTNTRLNVGLRLRHAQRQGAGQLLDPRLRTRTTSWAIVSDPRAAAATS